MVESVQAQRFRAPDPGQLRAIIDLVLSNEGGDRAGVPLHHAPEILARAPAKLEILVNSLVVFIERGFGPVTVQDLLDAAGISRRTFYKYFRNKIDVLESLYKLSIDLMVLRYKADVGRATSIEEAAQRMVDVFFGYHKDLAPVIRMMQEEAIRADSPLAPHRAEAQNLVVLLVNDELQRIAGVMIDPMTIRAVLWAQESVSMEILRINPPSVEAIERGREVMVDLAGAALERAVNKAMRKKGTGA